MGYSRELGGAGLFPLGHFKLSVLQGGSDTDSAPRELWARVYRKWSEEANRSYVTPLDDLHWLSPPTLTFTIAFSTSRSNLPLHLNFYLCTFCPLYLCLLTYLTTEFENKEPEGFIG